MSHERTRDDFDREVEAFLADPSRGAEFVLRSTDETDRVTIFEAKVLYATTGVALERHLATSCVVTARYLGFLHADHSDWAEVEVVPEEADVFRVVIGEDYANPEHVLTAVRSRDEPGRLDVLQSFWNRYTVRRDTFLGTPEALIAAVCTPEGWRRVVGDAPFPGDRGAIATVPILRAGFERAV